VLLGDLGDDASPTASSEPNTVGVDASAPVHASNGNDAASRGGDGLALPVKTTDMCPMSSVGVLIADPARHRVVSTILLQTRASSLVPVDLDAKLAQVERFGHVGAKRARLYFLNTPRGTSLCIMRSDIFRFLPCPWPLGI